MGRFQFPDRGPPDAQQGEITATPGFGVKPKRCILAGHVKYCGASQNCQQEFRQFRTYALKSEFAFKARYRPSQLTKGKIVDAVSTPPQMDEKLAKRVKALRDLCARRPSAHIAANKNERSRETLVRILDSATAIFTQDGHAGLSLRKVADRAGIAVGNLTYHFPNKKTLLAAMFEERFATFVDGHLREFDANGYDPLEMLLSVVKFYAFDAQTSHQFFYQMWGYAASDRDARDMVRKLYSPIGRFILDLVLASNPDLTFEQARRAVLQIFSLEEGYKLFIGMGPENDIAIAKAEEDLRALTVAIVMQKVTSGETP